MAERRSESDAMIAAPAQLASWLPQLEALPADLALGLYPLIARLSSVLGPLPGSCADGLGEPEGYAGVARRGPYPRLLPTEWLLASELPDEFMRRAIHAEHLFFELARRDERGARRAIVLFDAGPSQLGAPRLVQLAVLIAFARRAQAAFAQFGWGVLQAPDAELVAELSRSSLERLLAQRSPRDPSEAHALAWQQRIGPLAREDDAWLVGGPELAALAPLRGWPRLRLEQSLQPGQRCVELELEHPRRPPRKLLLELPPEPDCVQLLRDPYRSAQPAPRRQTMAFDVSRPIWFSLDGRRVFAWLPDGAAVSFPVPNSARAQPGKARVLRGRPGETLLACGSIGRRMLALSQDANGLYLHGSKLSGPGERLLVTIEAGPDHARVEAETWRAGGVVFEVDRQIYALSGTGELLVHDGQGQTLRRVRDVLLAAPWALGGAFHVRIRAWPEEPAGQRFAVMEAERLHLGKRWTRQLAVEVGQPGRCYLGHLGAKKHCMLLHTAPQQVTISAFAGQAIEQLAVPARCEVFGVLGLDDKACMLVLEPDRRRLTLVGRQHNRSFPPASSDIVQACASPGAPHIAYLTRGGELVVHGAAADAAWLRILPPEELA